MFARVTRFRIKPENLDDVTEMLPRVREQIRQIAGGVANYAMWNADGSGLTVALYESEAAAEAAAPQIQAIWSGLASHFAAPPEFEAYGTVANMRD